MVLIYEENRLYTAECNICGAKFSVQKKSQNEMEKFLISNGWAVWKSHTVHQPKVACSVCKNAVEGLIAGGRR